MFLYIASLVILTMDNPSKVNGFLEMTTYTSSSNCSNKQYFELDMFKCAPCGTGFVKSDDGMSCKCPTSNKILGSLGGQAQQRCVPCKPTEYVSLDQSTCVQRNCFNNTNGKISCNLCKKNQIMVTHAANGSVLPTIQCITCAAGTYPDANRSFCQPCSLRISNASNTRLCSCDPKLYTLSGDVCVPNKFIKKVLFTTKEGFQSTFYERNWNLASFLCSLHNTTACQMLANMCVMSLYMEGDDYPCSKWRDPKSEAVPALMYGEDESYSVLLRKKIPVIYSLNENSEVNHINISGIAINVDGKIHEVTDMKSKWMIPCPTMWKETESHLFKFGVNYRFKCKMGVQQLIAESETMFYEPYLRYIDTEKSSVPMLYTLPVLIRGDLINFNKENDINTWQLVKRFYIFDKTSGLSLNANGKEILKYFRYAKHIHVNIRIRRKGRDERNKIYPPLFIIEYGELNEMQIENDRDVELEFSVNYELDGGSMIHGMEIAVGTLSAFATVYSILQSWSHSRRSGRLGLDLYSVLRFFIIVSGNLANTFFIVAFGASAFSFMLFKTQKSVYAVPPSDRDESALQSYIIVAFSLKIVEVLAVNWRQITTDICFLDWEKPPQASNDLGLRGANAKTEQPLSFWRPYFVANEWNEIQSLRKISLPVHLVACIFVLEIFGVSSFANIGIDITNHSSGFLTSSVYQLALSGLVFLTLYFVHLLVAILIYERFICNFIQDFMDVCSISNVSILLLDAQLHGYYLHGRCVHASCDSDARGLQSGLPYRAFVVRCTQDFRLYFSRLSIHMNSRDMKWQWHHHLAVGNEQQNLNESTLTGIQGSRGRPGSRTSRKDDGDARTPDMVSGLPPPLERREQASRLINKFLTAFFDHALEDLDYEVREKRWIERLLDVELINESSNKTLLLYNASGDPQSFQRTIWYGQEWTLATFDLYLFCFVQMLSGSYVLAALINAVVWKILSMCRNFGGKKNIARKTLIDERFLV